MGYIPTALEEYESELSHSSRLLVYIDEDEQLRGASLQTKKIWYCAWCGKEQTFTDKTPQSLIDYDNQGKRTVSPKNNL